MRLVVSTMKDEGPFILEWVAYYQFLGFDHFIINTNDCSDGTDKIIKRLEEMGIASHIHNPGPWPKGPQASAYKNAMAHPRFKEAEWVLVCDADEFLDISVGAYTLDSLFEATPETDVYPFVWRLFGHSGITKFEDRFIIEQMTMAAPIRQTWPPQARAFKSLVRMNGAYKAISTHRPKGLRAKQVRWTDGDGQRIYGFETQGWAYCRSGNGFGTNLARMNHYAVRSIESYLMKRQRGDVNTTSFHSKMEESGERYWQLHCWNVVHEPSMKKKIDLVRERFAALRDDARLDELHCASVQYHKEKIIDSSKIPQAKAFTERYELFQSAKTVSIADDALVDPTQALNRVHFDPDCFLRTTQGARLKEIAVRKKANRLPWFANMDALETIKYRENIDEIIAAYSASRSKEDALPELAEAMQNSARLQQEQKSARQTRISLKRNMFLDELSGRKRPNWLRLE